MILLKYIIGIIWGILFISLCITTFLIYISVLLIVPIVISFILMIRYALRNKNKKAIIYTVILHVLFILVFIGPGKFDFDKLFLNLFADKFIAFRIFCTVLAIFFFILYCLSINKGNKNKKRIKE